MEISKKLLAIRLREADLPRSVHHFRDGELLPRPAELRIVQYADAHGYYLLYLDDTGREMTDTYHDTVAGALGQARFEFGIEPAEWHNAENPD